MKKKIIIAIVLVIIILLGIFVIISTNAIRIASTNSTHQDTTADNSGSVNIIGKHSSNKTTTSPTTAQVKQTKENVKSLTEDNQSLYAQNVAMWLMKVKNQEGNYDYGFQCPNTKKCTPLKIDYRAGLPVIWSKYQYYLNSNNSAALKELMNDIDNHLDESKIPVIQNDLWNCRLMFELSQSTNIPPQYKEKAWRVCLRGWYNQADFSDIEKIITSQTFIEPNYSMLLNGQKSPPDLSANEGKLLEYGSYASDYIFKYKMYKNINDLRIAKLLFAKALYLYSSNQKPTLDDSTIIAVVATDFYNLLKEKKYLNIAESNLLYKKTDKCESLMGCILGIFAGRQLASITGNYSYRKIADNIMVTVINNHYNSRAIADGSNNIGAFYTQDNSGYYYLTRENAMIMGLLSQK